MDVEAIEGVRDAVLRYADAINLNDIDQFGDVFAEDSVWDVQGHFRAEGRKNICSAFGEARARFDWLYQVIHGTRVLSVTGGTAKARSYVAEYANVQSRPYFLLASYQDRLIRQDGVWRFSSRICDPLYGGPPDLSAPPKALRVLKRN